MANLASNMLLIAVNFVLSGGENTQWVALCPRPDASVPYAWQAPTFVYNVTGLDGTPLGTNMTPTKARPNEVYNGKQIVAPGLGVGSGYYDNAGVFQLYDIGERLVQE